MTEELVEDLELIGTLEDFVQDDEGVGFAELRADFEQDDV